MSNYSKIFHKYHIVDKSPWPIIGSLSSLLLVGGLAFYMHGYVFGSLILFLGIVSVLLCMYVWWRDVIIEGFYLGMHTKQVQQGLRIGVLLFILSEIMFFSAFFWAYFHSSLAPTIELGSIWPPEGIEPFNPYKIPLLNTYVLVLSGIFLTAAHHYLMLGKKNDLYFFWTPYFPDEEPYSYWMIRPSKMGLCFFFTILLAFFFTCLQIMEYLEAPFDISDSVYGSSFFMATGFHGFHVIIGTIFLVVCYYRCQLVLMDNLITGKFKSYGTARRFARLGELDSNIFYKRHRNILKKKYFYKILYIEKKNKNITFSKDHHVGFEAAAWYWHFVDVVWLFLFLSIYIWGSAV